MHCRSGEATKQIYKDASIEEKVQSCYKRIWILRTAMVRRVVSMAQVSEIISSRWNRNVWIRLKNILYSMHYYIFGIILNVLRTCNVAGKGPFTKWVAWLKREWCECCCPDACWCIPRLASLSLLLWKNIIWINYEIIVFFKESNYSTNLYLDIKPTLQALEIVVLQMPNF